MVRRVLLAIPALLLLGACVPDEQPTSYYGDGYRGGTAYRGGYNDGTRTGYYDRSGGTDRPRYGRYRQDPNAVNEYNRPGP